MARESGEREVSRRERLEEVLVRALRIIVVVFAGLLVLYFLQAAFSPDTAPSWTGFGEVTTSSGTQKRTLWDWLELLIVPAILAGGAAWIAFSQQKRELAEKEVDREIAKDRQEQESLENYYNKISELLLNHDLREKTDDEDEERSIARARTLSVLRSLNEPRKGQVLRFLYESNLINGPKTVIDLSGADLSNADLKRAYLRDICLHTTYLKGADLYSAHLFGANLTGADLIDVNLINANLIDADLRGADLTRTDLRIAQLINADLRHAKIADTDLRGADLRGANLRKIRLKSSRLEGAVWDEKTIWPDGFDSEAAGANFVDDEGRQVRDSE